MLIKYFIPLPSLPYALSPLKGEAGGLGTHCMCATGTQCSRSRRPPRRHPSLLLFPTEALGVQMPWMPREEGQAQEG